MRSRMGRTPAVSRPAGCPGRPRIRSVCLEDIGRCSAVSSLQTIRRCTTEASLHSLPSRGLTVSLVNRLTLSRVPAVGTSR